MFENKDLEKLFKNGLEATQSFDRQEQQWEIVQQKLRKKSRRFIFWLLPIFLTAVSFVLFQMQSSGSDELPTSENKPEKHQSNLSNNDEEIRNTNIQASPILVGDNTLALESTLSLNNSSNLITNSQLKEYKTETTTSKVTNNEDVSIPHFIKKSKTNLPPLLNNKLIGTSKLDQTLNTSAITTIYSSESFTGVDASETHPNTTKETLFALSNLPLKFAPLLYDHKLDIHITPVIPSNRSTLMRIDIGSGLFTEFIKEDSLNNNVSPGFYADVMLNYSRFTLKAGYRNHKVNRSIASNFASYNAIDPTFVYGYSAPDSVNTIYTSHLIDLSLGYSIYQHNWFELQLHAGIQAQKSKNGKISYAYGNVYNPIVNEYDLANNFEISNVLVGTNVRFRLYQSLGLSLRYDVSFPTGNTTLKWPGSHQLSTGLIFTIK